ncbi:CpaD family pilus assembly protein [Sphingomonas sp. MMS24-J45]|uniref:CpaD family pilus assembly protein n=1 Tax=Sphingomonas sp. MMS24-J45 TaxID=3238806 RepID=UPI00384B1C1C
MYKRTLLIATGLAPALLIGACTTVGPGSGTENRGLESVHQPVVSRNDYALDVATSGNGLAPGEEQRLAGWMGSLRLGYGDQVAIDDPNPNGSGVRDDVAREVARYGLLVSDEAPLTNAPVVPGTVRVVVSRMKASVPSCPDFSRVRGPDFEGHTGSNQGCAINTNLAAMVANPTDLVRGQTGNGITDTATSGKAIDMYRKATPTGAGGATVKAESSKGGN